ncbi:MAG: DUF6261 family protein [Ekhidna sp.]
MLKQLSYSLLTSEELIKTADRLAQCTKNSAFEEILEKRIKKTSEASDILSNALNESLSNVYAAKVQQADLHRDDAFQAFKYGVLSASYRSEPITKVAGEALVEIVRKHGFSLYSLGYIAQSEVMKTLIDELETRRTEISQSGVADLLAEMTNSNDEFNRIFHEKLQDDPSSEAPQIVVSKSELSHQITLFLNHVELLEDDKEKGIKDVVDKINYVIDKVMVEAKGRQEKK